MAQWQLVSHHGWEAMAHSAALEAPWLFSTEPFTWPAAGLCTATCVADRKDNRGRGSSGMPLDTVPMRHVSSSDRTYQGGHAVTEKSDDAAIAKANLVEHLKNIDAACDDARLSAVEKIRRVKEEVDKAQDCLKRLSL